MLISGGHVIGINKVKVKKDQFQGDGIWTELSIEPYVGNKLNDLKKYVNDNFYDKQEVDELHKEIVKDYLKKDDAEELYQPIGDYALSADVGKELKKTETTIKTWVKTDYNQEISQTYLNKNDASTLYQPLGNYVNEEIYEIDKQNKQDKITLGSGFNTQKFLSENILETTDDVYDIKAGKNIELNQTENTILIDSIRNNLFSDEGNIGADFNEETQQWTLRAPAGNGADWLYLSANSLNTKFEPIKGTIVWENGCSKINTPNNYSITTQIYYKNDEDKIIPYLVEIPLKYKNSDGVVKLERKLTFDLSKTVQQISTVSDVYYPKDGIEYISQILETDENIPGTFEIRSFMTAW